MTTNSEQLKFWESVVNYETEIDSVLHEQNELTSEIKQIDLDDKTIIDIGCGSGNLFPYLTSCKKVIACDFSENMLRLSKNTANTLQLGNIKFEKLDIIEAPVPELADILFCINGFFPENHLQIQAFLENIENSIHKNGEIYILVSSFESFLRELQILMRLSFDRYTNEPNEKNLKTLKRYQGFLVGVHGYYYCGKRIRKYWLLDEVVDEFSQNFTIVSLKTLNFERDNIDFKFKRYFIKLKRK